VRDLLQDGITLQCLVAIEGAELQPRPEARPSETTCSSHRLSTPSLLEDDEILRLAVTELVEIVGAAAKQVSQRNATPTHHYFDVDLDVL
jgi:hypothetical protein